MKPSRKMTRQEREAMVRMLANPEAINITITRGMLWRIVAHVNVSLSHPCNRGVNWQYEEDVAALNETFARLLTKDEPLMAAMFEENRAGKGQGPCG